MELLFQQETDLEKRICMDPDWKKGVMWGKPRPGHSDGQVISHIAEVLANKEQDALVWFEQLLRKKGVAMPIEPSRVE